MHDDLLDTLSAAHDYAGDLDWYLRRQYPFDPTEPFNDRQHTAPIHRHGLNHTAQILYGRVVDVIAHCHWYKVQPEGLKTTVPCQMLTHTSLSPFGAKAIEQLQPNTAVWFIWHRQQAFGAILGAIPERQEDPRRGLSDYLTQAGRCGVQVDGVHRFPFKLPQNGTISDWSAGRPIDGLGVGEAGRIAETGVGYFADSFMAFLRADENVGVWAFYHDQLLRLAGHNAQFRTAGAEHEFLDDEGEFDVTQYYTPYPWETMGVPSPTTDPGRDLTAQQAQVDTPEYGYREPFHDNQQPFHRVQHYQGYLGQGGKRLVAAPPPDGPDGGYYRHGQRAVHPALFDESVGLEGSYHLRARRLLLSRRPGPMPRRLRRPEDAGGDNAANYRAAGVLGDGPAHTVRAGPAATGNRPDLQRVLGAGDSQAYGFNFEALVGFHYHELDWYVPEESEVLEALGLTGFVPDYAQLEEQTLLDLPTPGSVRVDERYGDVAVHPGVSFQDLTEDGNIITCNAFGAEIRLINGDIEIRCPGDIKLLPGRRLLGLAGFDAVIKAHNCIDLSTTNGDVRVSAGNSCYLTAAAGILLDSRAESQTFDGFEGATGTDVVCAGITLKAASAAVSAFANEIHLRSGVPVGGDPAGDGNGIFLDSGKGAGRVTVHCGAFERFLTRGAFDTFLEAGSVQSANVHTGAVNIMGACLCVGSSITATGSLTAGGWVTSTNGHIASGLSSLYHQIGTPDPTAQPAVDGFAADSAAARASGQTLYNALLVGWLYLPGGAGDDDAIAATVFTFRTQDQYATNDFLLTEGAWQQRARLAGQTLSTWTEATVNDTYPFPGEEKTTSEAAFYRQDLTLVDAAGVARDRTDPAYATPAYNVPAAVTLDGNYTIIDPLS